MLNPISGLSGPALWPQRPSRRPPIAEVARYIEANFSERVTLNDLASVAELSVFRLVTVFRRETGISPYRYLSAVRVRKAQELMRNGVAPAMAVPCAAMEVRLIMRPDPRFFMPSTTARVT